MERRSTLSSLMREHESEIIKKWLEYLQGEIREDEIRIGKPELHDLLVGIRAFFVPKENESLHTSLEHIQHQLASDQSAYFQLITALYVFPSAVCYILYISTTKFVRFNPHSNYKALNRIGCSLWMI